MLLILSFIHLGKIQKLILPPESGGL